MEKGHKPCVWDGHTYLNQNGFYNIKNGIWYVEKYGYVHTRKCSVCHSWIEFSYYLNTYGSGEIHYLELGENGNDSEYCTDDYGNRIDCNNVKTCSKCKAYRPAHPHIDVNVNSGTLACPGCDKIWGTVKYENNVDTTTTPNLNVITLECELYELTLDNFSSGPIVAYPSEYYEIYKQELTSISADKKRFTVTIKAKLKSNIKTIQPFKNSFSYNSGATMQTDGISVYPDKIKPEITEITSDGSLTEWRKTKQIVIKGTENYCDNVDVKIVEVGNEENIIFDGGANVVNGKYEISCVPEIEAGEIGKKYKVIVTDTCENSGEKEFEIAKVDSIPPEITSGESLQKEWAQEKLFTFSSTDTGIGQVQIAFNDESDYRLATSNGSNFTREYKFVGDVYRPKKGIVLYKDGLGNVSSKEVIINKIDNTAPTITNASLHNNKLTVNANDIKEGLGEGSGVAKYKYLASRERITNPYINESYTEVLSSDEIRIENIAESKYIYIYAEDLARGVPCKISM